MLININRRANKFHMLIKNLRNEIKEAIKIKMMFESMKLS